MWRGESDSSVLCDRDLMLSEGDFPCNNLSYLTAIVAYLKFLGNLIGILLDKVVFVVLFPLLSNSFALFVTIAL